MTVQEIGQLRFPEDRALIAQLTLDEKAFWYGAQNPQDMVWLGNKEDFTRFWRWYYMVPLKVKRLIYKLKFW